MCGIAGYLNLDLTAEQRLPLLRRMCDAIRHRGPDDDGCFADASAGLGMRRLSIIDLTGGHQPLANEDGSCTIVFNGEIYNYAELRTRLQQRGHQFRTAADTEVILHLYEERGEACVQELNGMFAFAIWDTRRRRLLLARDRMGIKPLYYFLDGPRLVFASEIKAILASDAVPRTIRDAAIWDYLTFRYVPQPATIWQNVHKLPPGHLLTFAADAPAPVVSRYWDLPYDDAAMQPQSDAVYDAEFARLFEDAVKLQLHADVPVGVLLSGGLDSSAVAAAIAAAGVTRLASFSVAFADSPATDERPYARLAARHLGLEHHEVVIDQKDFCGFLPALVRHTDEPLADLASVPLHYVSQLARKQVTVVLSGEGSDEILGGYCFEQRARWWRICRQYQQLPAVFRAAAGRVARLCGPAAAAAHAKLNLPVEHALNTMTHFLDSAEKRHLWPTAPDCPDSLLAVRQELARPRTVLPLHRMLYTYCQSWLVEDLLMKADKMTMANSLELRVPFLDHRIVEWAARTPDWVKVGGGPAGGYTSKRILRRYAASRLPRAILTRPKQGFPVPVYDWLGGPLAPFASDLLSGQGCRLRRRFAGPVVDQTIRSGTAARAPERDRHLLWHLIILELWLREWEVAR